MCSLMGTSTLPAMCPPLLGARRLVLDVDAGGALLDEHLGQLHDGRDAAVARVGVGDDRPQEVRVGQVRALGLGHAEALLALLAVVEELREPEVLHFVRHRGLTGQLRLGKRNISHHRVVGQIWARLIARGRRRRRHSPTGARRRCRGTWPSASP